MSQFSHDIISFFREWVPFRNRRCWSTYSDDVLATSKRLWIDDIMCKTRSGRETEILARQKISNQLFNCIQTLQNSVYYLKQTWLNIHSLHLLLHKHAFTSAQFHLQLLELHILCRTAHSKNGRRAFNEVCDELSWLKYRRTPSLVV